MKRLIEIPLEDGSSMIIEVDDPEAARASEATKRGLRDLTASIERVENTFETALDKIKPAAAAILAKLREMRQAPDQIDIEFGIKLGAKAVAFIASADTDAHFVVNLSWKREPQK